MRPIRIAVVGLGFCVLSTASGLAGEGRTPIFEPATISTPGSYVLTQDVVVAFAHAVTVLGSAQNVDIDLNGFILGGVQASGLVSLKVHNGRMQSPGITVTGSRHLIVDRVTFNDAGISSFDLESFSITRNLFPRGGEISLDSTESLAHRPRGVVEDNVLANGIIKVSAQSGAAQRGDGVLVRDNQVSGGTFWAILLGSQDGCVVSGNRISEAGQTGISVLGSQDCVISNNTVTGSGFVGIEVIGGAGHLIENNVSNRNGRNGDPSLGSGIYSGVGTSVIRGNVTNDNALAGLHIGGPSNVYTGNIARGNLAIPAGATCANPAPTCAVPYGASSAAPDLCNDGDASSLCDNMTPGPPPS